MKKAPFAAAVLTLCLFGIPIRASDDFAGCLDLAQGEVPGGTLLLGRQEDRGSKLGFYFLVSGRVVEVEVRVQPRKVILVKDTEGIKGGGESGSKEVIEAVSKRKGAKIPNARFLEIAQETKPGSEPVGIAVGVAQGKPVMKVYLNGGSTVVITFEGRRVNTQ